MKFALVNNHREEAQPNLKGECPSCNSPMIARCGERRIYHWAHLGHRICDPWWENETDWHRNWKNQFPTNWQEIVHHAQDGERHIADVKTSANWVIEFQHSPIKSEEKRSREHFYKHLIWVVNGVRRERDKGKFYKVLHENNRDNRRWPELQILFPEGALLRDWIDSSVHVIFDFGEETLWWLFPESYYLNAYVLPISREKFIDMHRNINVIGVCEFDLIAQKFSAFLEQSRSPKPPSPPQSQTDFFRILTNSMRRRGYRL